MFAWFGVNPLRAGVRGELATELAEPKDIAAANSIGPDRTSDSLEREGNPGNVGHG
jgi:hypothetical protein